MQLNLDNLNLPFKFNPLVLMNAALDADSYKLSHKFMEPEGTERIYDNFTPRTDKYFKQRFPEFDGKVVVFGIQVFILSQFMTRWKVGFFDRPKTEVLEELREILFPYLGMDSKQLQHFAELHDLGYLPLRVKSLPEGTLCPIGVPMLTIENTDPRFSWLPNYCETVFSSEVWKAVTIATTAREFRRLANKWWDKTVVDHTFKKFSFHDFSSRGHANRWSSAVCGAGTLLSFNGTDNIPAVVLARAALGAGSDVASSVPASEHSVTTLGINHYGANDQELGEYLTLERLLTSVFPTGLLSYVSDSYDYWRVLTSVLPRLKHILEKREGKLVIRPDCYSSDTQILTNRGFIFFKDLTAKDLVAQVLDDGSYEFVKPLKIVNEHYKGKMYHFKDHHGKVDQLVTPNHRMIYKQIKATDRSVIAEKVVYAEDMKSKGNFLNYFERSAKAQNLGKSLTHLERLNIAFQADGSYSTGCKNSIKFSFSKKRKIERLSELLTEASIPFKVYELADGKKEFNVTLDKTLVHKDFSWVSTANLCSNWCEEFLEELKHWDSSIRSNGRFKYDTTVESCVRVVELVAISAGKGVFITQSQDNRKEHFSDVYTAHIMDNNKCGGQSWTKEEVDYEGTVHCVQVPTGRLIVKRNRSVIVCGNSGDPVDIVVGTSRHVIELESLDDLYEIMLNAEEDDRNTYIVKGTDIYVELSDTLFDDRREYGSDQIVKSFGSVESILQFNYLSQVSLNTDSPEWKGSIQVLWELFGGTVNEKGFKELPPYIGLIYGDGITFERAEQILEGLAAKGFAASNVVFGVGLT